MWSSLQNLIHLECQFSAPGDRRKEARDGRKAELDQSEARRLKALEQENARLKKLLADAMLDNAILKEAASGNY